MILTNLIKEFEGCKLIAYRCPAGILTCGWGQTGSDIHVGTQWTQEYADKRLEETAKKSLSQALKASPKLAKASEEKQAAIADFIYNCGASAYQTSTLKKYVDIENWFAASKEILKWNKAKGIVLAGLTRRRIKESELLKL